MSARDARRAGIRPRSPHEILEQNTPWKAERVVCMSCGHRWVVVDMIGSEVTPKCDWCGARNSEPEAEAPLFVPSLQ